MAFNRLADIALRGGMSFMATSQIKVLSIGATKMRAYVKNPSGSNRNIILQGFITDNFGNVMAAADIKKSVTDVLGGSAITPQNLNLASGQTSIAEVKVDISSSGLSTGQVLTSIGIPASTRETFDEIQFLIPPGQTLGVEANFGALLANVNAQFVVFWYKEMLV